MKKLEETNHITMADLPNTIRAIKKLNSHNYWKTCIDSYLQAQDLWEVIGGGETTTPQEAGETLRKWNVDSRKSMDWTMMKYFVH